MMYNFSMGSIYALVGNTLIHWPTDWIIIGAVAVFIALDTLRNGGTRAATLALALPATLFVMDTLPRTLFIGSVLKQFSTPVLQAVLFGIVFVALYVLIYRIIGFYSTSTGAPVEALLTGLAATAILMVVWLHVPALDSLWRFGPQVHIVFSESYRFWWLAASYLSLAFARS
jgi:hypothetical protein